MRWLCVACGLLLAGCATADVTRTCVETEVMVAHIRPFLSASPEAALAADAIIFGAVVCGSPQYAAARDTVLAAMGRR